MKFVQFEDRQKWNDIVNSSDCSDILQTWEWGELKKIEGWQPYRFALVDNNNEILIGAMVQVKKVRIFGSLAYIPHGPFYSDLEFLKKYWGEFEKGLINWAEESGVFLFEMEPKATETDVRLDIFTNWLESGRNRQAKYKVISNLLLSEEELLAKMEKNTRYNVRYASKHGVEIKMYRLDDPIIDTKIKEFHSLVLEMQKRASGYPVRSLEYFQRLVNEFKNTDNILLIEASYNGDIIVMNISEFTNTWASSFYAGSNRLHSKLKAPYLLRWESMLEAKRRGCKVYDFWGIVPNSKQHEGYSKQKLSFGGDRIDFVGILEYPLNFKAKFYKLVLQLGRIFLRLKWK